MVNRERGEVSLTVGERTYTLVLNTNAMAAIEDHLSTPLREVTWESFWERIAKGSVRAIRVLLWGMARKYHPELTVEAIGELVDSVGGLEGLTRVLHAAQGATTPDADDAATLAEANHDRPRTAQATRRRGRNASALQGVSG